MVSKIIIQNEFVSISETLCSRLTWNNGQSNEKPDSMIKLLQNYVV